MPDNKKSPLWLLVCLVMALAALGGLAVQWICSRPVESEGEDFDGWTYG